MKFEAAIISVFDDGKTVNVHDVSEFIDEDFARFCTVEAASKYLTEKYGELFLGNVSSVESTVETNTVGTYAICEMPEQNKVEVCRLDERTVSGWVSSSTEKFVTTVGYFTFVKCENEVLLGYKNMLSIYESDNTKLRNENNDVTVDNVVFKTRISNLSSDIEFVECENKNLKRRINEFQTQLDESNKYVKNFRNESLKLYDEINSLKIVSTDEKTRADTAETKLKAAEQLIDEFRKNSSAKSEDNRQLLSELDNLRKLNDKDLHCIQELYTEISDLRRKLMEKDKEIANLREDAVYAIRSGSTPMSKVAVAATPAYDEVVARVKAFDKSRLLTRKQRDYVLKGKQRID
ncbi:Hypothetical protein PACV_149 [Pacmanvirus A23]|uniref:Hypothetical protein n=1 Tax=Pacmanvirus A23 TaxID=1932881 RepID=UPI000A092F7E|nr:Hypothetical protein B9W72_gp147 [Pacmanvirus A23]SIP85864.1 Hypothetical protein PACV_149 [Pacmanvirus A23]